MKNRKMKYGLTIIGCLVAVLSWSQDSLKLSLHKAVTMGVDSSKQLMMNDAQIQAAIEQMGTVKSHALPQAKVSLMGSEAFIPTQTFQLDGVTPKPLHLPSHSTVYIGNLGVTQVIFGGNKIRYAKQSAALLKKSRELKAAHDKNGVMLSIVQAYVNLYEVDQNIKIIDHSIRDITGRVEETIKFKNQGLATQNDVLRFKLEKSKMQIAKAKLESSRKIANFAIVTLLGLPQNTVIKEDDMNTQLTTNGKLSLGDLSSTALQNRQDLQVLDVKKQMAEINLKSIKGNKLPTLGAGVNVYYLNPNDRFIPKQHTFLVPMTIGLNLSWDISSLYTNKHKEAKARIQQKEIMLTKSATTDRINMEVNKDYQNYLTAKQKIKMLQTSVQQAEENNRIMEQKYANQLATTTDRIDAQTLYYKALIDLSIAKAEAIKAGYKLKSTTGTLKTEF